MPGAAAATALRYEYCGARLIGSGASPNQACFAAHPLEFAHPERQMLRFANASHDRWINATMVTEGGGVGWMRNPKPPTFTTCDWVIPRAAPGHVQEHCNFHCPGCGAPNYPDDAACPLKSCPEKYPGTPPDVGNDPRVFPDLTGGANYRSFVVEDTLKVPTNISAGEWVVGWRW